MTVELVALAMVACGALTAPSPLARSPLDDLGATPADHSGGRASWRRLTGLASAAPRHPADSLAHHIELVAASLAAGLTARGALEVASAIGDVADDAASDAFASACTGALIDHGRGLSLAASLRRAFREVESDGLPVESYLSIMVAQDRDGLAVAGDLEELAATIVEQRRRERARRARRLPVTMLFPLVTCVLPAFALLTIAPVVLESIAGLS